MLQRMWLAGQNTIGILIVTQKQKCVALET